MKERKFADDEDVICTANGWLEDDQQCSSTTESELWRIAGPSAFQLNETTLKSDTFWCAYLTVNCVRLRTFWTRLILTTIIEHLYELFIYVTVHNACSTDHPIMLPAILQTISATYLLPATTVEHYSAVLSASLYNSYLSRQSTRISSEVARLSTWRWSNIISAVGGTSNSNQIIPRVQIITAPVFNYTACILTVNSNAYAANRLRWHVFHVTANIQSG